MPTVLGIFFYNFREISHDACFIQLVFIHSFTFIESSVILCMAIDCFVAIYNPLRYAFTLTPPRTAKMGLVSLLRGVVLIFSLPVLLKQYQYRQANILYHSYSLNQEVMTMTCSDVRVNIIYTFFATVSSVGLDFLLILLSYVMIFKTVVSFISHKEHLRALNSCVSHVFAVLLSSISGISLSVIYRFMKSSSPLVENVIGNVCSPLLPPMNPVMNSVKTKPICTRRVRLFIK